MACQAFYEYPKEMRLFSSPKNMGLRGSRRSPSCLGLHNAQAASAKWSTTFHQKHAD
jgi:hypothetical protein